ncbi:MAG: sulfotransferase domain-containing protein [Ilumatobacteraceae bacterium]|nr:sulfotransferase domain-containing protein [Ilumatobacteraceae bacterium]
MNTFKKRARQTAAELGRQLTAPIGIATSTWRMLPDFLIVGAQRAGTTSLYKYLTQHPDVGSVRLGKGVHYFDTNADKSLAWYRSHFPLRPGVVPFGQRPTHVGEGAPYYLFHPECASRINTTLPSAKIIAILRDPIERAHSHWAHETARGFEDLSFERALDAEEERLEGQAQLLSEPTGYSFHHQHHSYVARGQYAEQVTRLRDVFGEDRVLILSSNELFTEPSEAYSKTLEFLGLSPFSAQFRVHNARTYEGIEPATEQRLARLFDESNERLVEMLGAEFDFRRG